MSRVGLREISLEGLPTGERGGVVGVGGREAAGKRLQECRRCGIQALNQCRAVQRQRNSEP